MRPADPKGGFPAGVARGGAERTMSQAPLTTQEVLHVARLSRLAVDEGTVERMRTQLSSILGHIAKLQALPTEGVEPMAHPMKIVNRLGADEPKACMPVEELLKNAPAVEDRYLAVPKVLGDGGGA
jgi:aspartyl-tRNA(Asn)/glutamyl-tRNA(Gln) amidotransferase subunit C